MGIRDRMRGKGYWLQGGRDQKPRQTGGQDMGAWVMGSEWRIKDFN